MISEEGYFMNYNENQQPGGNASYYRMPDPYKKAQGFATASMVLGILAFVSVFSMTVVPAFIFGSLAIILGILSRGNLKTLQGRALAGIIVGGCALVINLLLCIFSFYVVFSDPEIARQYWDMINQTYTQMWGMSLSDILKSYGFDAALPH